MKNLNFDSVETARKIKEKISKECNYSPSALIKMSAKTIKDMKLKTVYPRHLLKKVA